MRTRKAASILAAGIGLAIVATSATAAEVTLKGGFFIANKKSIFRQAYDGFVAKVNVDGEGSIEIGQVVGQDAIPSRQMGNAVKSGLLDVVGIPPAYMANLVKLATGLVPTTKTPSEMRKNGAWDIYVDMFAKRANTHLLAQFGGEASFHIYTNKPVASLAAFKGMKLRTSNTYKAFFDALGAHALQMPRREIFTAMERGVVDGYANLDSEVLVQGWAEVTKYRVDPGFYHPIIIVGVNLDRWKSLKDAQRAVMTNAGLYLENELSRDLGLKDAAAGATLIKKGMKVSALKGADAEKFLELSYTSQWDVIEKRDPEMGTKLRALIGR